MRALLHTMRLRLTLWYTLALALALLGFGLLTYSLLRYQLVRHHDGALREVAKQVERVIALRNDCAHLTAEQRARLDRIGDLVLFHEEGGKNQVFYRSPDALGVPVPLHAYSDLIPGDPGRFETVPEEAPRLRMYSVPYQARSGRRGVIHVMQGLGDLAAPLEGLRFAFLLMAPAAVGVSAAGGYWLARRALAPVDEVTRRAREIEAGSLSRRLPAPKADDEIGRLVETLNQMIGRLAASFEGMRRFTADAAHELRGPLATMKGAIDVTLSRPREAAAYQVALQSIGEDVDRLRAITEDLLILARADAGRLELVKAPLRLDVVAAEVVESLAHRAAAQDVTLAARCPAPVLVLGDERWLRQLVFNLCDNAIKFSAHPSGKAERAKVDVEVRAEEQTAHLEVTDSGPGIPEQAISRIFDRFFRADEARGRQRNTEGSGLGLAIAAWIVEAHGGRIRAENRAQGGARLCVSLPRAG